MGNVVASENAITECKRKEEERKRNVQGIMDGLLKTIEIVAGECKTDFKSLRSVDKFCALVANRTVQKVTVTSAFDVSPTTSTCEGLLPKTLKFCAPPGPYM